MRLFRFQLVLMGPYMAPTSSLSLRIDPYASLWLLIGLYWKQIILMRPYGFLWVFISLFTCALLGTSSWFRKVVLLWALFRSSLHAHFKNSVTYEMKKT